MIQIRNFSIIAHVDHGKSTLADRLIDICSPQRKKVDQMLDSMDIERERGITIKSQTVRMNYKDYVLNLIDTPGHVDFTYEVSRGLASCEGSILVVDSTQGVEAQTIANVEKAIEMGHEIIPVLNKIDLPASDVEGVKKEIEELLGVNTSIVFPVSAKTGEGVSDLIDGIVELIPAPKMEKDNDTLKALLVDSWYDTYMGIVVLVRIISGTLSKGDKFVFLSNGKEYTVEKMGWFTPQPQYIEKLSAGEIGFITASIRQVKDTKVGDTIVHVSKEYPKPLPGFKPSIPVVFCGFFAIDKEEFEDLRDGLEKLSLNDSSFTFEMEQSAALGFGFRCGFLGLLHMEIVQERLEREFNIQLVVTAPSVIYQIKLKKGDLLDIYNPSDMPDISRIECIKEPWIEARIVVPQHQVGNVITLCQEKRGVQTGISYMSRTVLLVYQLPLNEVVFDFYDKLKSTTQGFATFDYEFLEHREGDLVKVDILVNGDIVDALAMIMHRDRSVYRGRKLCEKLKELIPRQQFKVALQAAIGSNVIARETVGSFRKDVTAKCYGGDVTRKRKLLEKQKEGKKRLKRVGKVDIPQSAFLSVVKFDS